MKKVFFLSLLFSALSGPAWSADAIYKYDALGRLVSVTVTDGPSVITITYAYDALGNRVSKTITKK